jgi:hypothetical protein
MRGEEYNDSLSRRVNPGASKLGIECYTNLRNVVLSLFSDSARDLQMTAMFHNRLSLCTMNAYEVQPTARLILSLGTV